jgi:DNA-binding winged helix-turn-helix (wHTH) protein/tetratricopeptide (TPR) repeat protein
MADLPGAKMGVFAFGEFEADLDLFELRRAGTLVEASRKCFDLLVYLIRHRERVVPKEELLANVWRAQALSDSAIPTAVLSLRRLLGDDCGSPRFISNTPGRGYRFIASVRELGGELEPQQRAARPREARGFAGSGFVGRVPELAAISAAFERSSSGVPQTVLIAGEAGIGKTRTAEEFAIRARGWGAAAVEGRCHEGEGAPAFWPWVQVVRGLLEQMAPGFLERDLRRLAPVLAQMVPELADRFPGLDPPPPLDAEPARFRLFDGLTQLLRAAAAGRSLLIVLDDLHRADPASLHYLAFAARELRDAKVLLLATYRDVDAQRDPPRLSIITELARQERSRSIQLNGLSATEVAELVAASALSGAAGGALAQTLHEQSGGNPFFLNQLVHLLEVGGGADRIASGTSLPSMLPRGIREAIARQLDGLPDETRNALSVAATMGREFPVAAVADVMGLSVHRLIARLEPAVDARLTIAIPERHGHHRFAHVLLRDSVYEQLDALERVDLHHRIARTLERVYADDLAPHSAELAYHFREATPESGHGPAVRFAVAAGEWASARLAYEDAARHYRCALEILEEAGPGNVVQRCEILLALGEVEMHAGERDRARRVFYAAAALAKRATNPELLARAALRLAPGFFAIEIGVFDSLLVELLEDAIAAVGSSDSALRAQLLARLAMAHGWSGAEEPRSRLTLEAIDVATRMGDPGSLAYALTAKHGLLWGPERIAERISLVDQMGTLAAASRNNELILMHLLFRITLGFELAKIQTVDSDIATYIRIAESLEQPQSLWYTRNFKAARALMQGRFLEAARYSEQMLAIGARVQDVNAINTFGVHAGFQLWEKGRAGEVVSFVQQFIERFPTIQGWRFSLAAMCYEGGDVTAARAHFRLLAENRFEAIPRNEQWGIAACMSAELCHWLGDSRNAEILYGELLPGAEYACAIGFGVAYFGSIARRLGNLAVTLENWSAAEDHFEHALQLEERAGAIPWTAHVLFDYARMHLTRGEPTDVVRARELAERSFQIAQRLELTNLERKIRMLWR